MKDFILAHSVFFFCFFIYIFYLITILITYPYSTIKTKVEFLKFIAVSIYWPIALPYFIGKFLYDCIWDLKYYWNNLSDDGFDEN
jgi:hypothetical protein